MNRCVLLLVMAVTGACFIEAAHAQRVAVNVNVGGRCHTPCYAPGYYIGGGIYPGALYTPTIYYPAPVCYTPNYTSVGYETVYYYRGNYYASPTYSSGFGAVRSGPVLRVDR